MGVVINNFVVLHLHDEPLFVHDVNRVSASP